jgi:CheY-like chemotaxis protein
MATAPRGAILVVDDEPTIAEVVGRYLERAGYSTRSVGDGKQALELARADPPDLVVLDLMLPGIGGLELLRRRDAMFEFLEDVPIAVELRGGGRSLELSHAGAAATSGARAGEAGIVGSRGSSASIATASLARSR